MIDYASFTLAEAQVALILFGPSSSSGVFVRPEAHHFINRFFKRGFYLYERRRYMSRIKNYKDVTDKCFKELEVLQTDPVAAKDIRRVQRWISSAASKVLAWRQEDTDLGRHDFEQLRTVLEDIRVPLGLTPHGKREIRESLAG